MVQDQNWPLWGSGRGLEGVVTASARVTLQGSWSTCKKKAVVNKIWFKVMNIRIEKIGLQ